MTSDHRGPPRSILITGASSGIGEALALAYAAPGISLFLSGRDERRLAAISDACRARSAAVEAAAVDVANRAAMATWIAGADAQRSLDLVVANAGISGGSSGKGEGEQQTRRIFEINVTGTLNTVLPAIPPMQRRGQGQIALMSSAASFRGMPGAPAYSASKAAVRAYGEALRGALAPSGIRVSVICPGFVRSRITEANPFPMPLLMDADRAARIICRGSRSGSNVLFQPPTKHCLVVLTAVEHTQNRHDSRLIVHYDGDGSAPLERNDSQSRPQVVSLRAAMRKRAQALNEIADRVNGAICQCAVARPSFDMLCNRLIIEEGVWFFLDPIPLIRHARSAGLILSRSARQAAIRSSISSVEIDGSAARRVRSALMASSRARCSASSRSTSPSPYWTTALSEANLPRTTSDLANS
ncbi:MAG: SDR family NAD(P)-dependent oxidoreductase [Alphaproteobacteria bacterium]|nr:SDR family NAD(P)-dependent oxidoreductase [Alphaproteobacteria bacterium]